MANGSLFTHGLGHSPVWMVARGLDKGPVWMILSALLFSLVGVFVKQGAAYFSTAELVFYRSAVSLVVVFLMTRIAGVSLSTSVAPAHLWRSLAGTVAMMLSFIAVTQLPLAMAASLNYTSPLFFTLFSVFWFKQRVHPVVLASILVGFAGVMLLLNPTFAGVKWQAGLAGVASGALAAIAYLGVNRLGELGEPEQRTVFYFSLVATLASGVWMACTHIRAIRAQDVLVLAGLGMCATGAQLCLTRAYSKGKSLAVTSLAYSNIVVSSMLGIWLWGDHHSAVEFMAMGLIVMSGIVANVGFRSR
ncbi:DMT family transporter [Burkholderiaceae bacterium DAT-1]|nr:DMT family transporter [Burkholderiaceae bacterium DAT-1]